MSSVIEVKPTGWANNGQGKVGTAPGNDVRSVFLDKDGITMWAFQSSKANGTANAGFARIKLSDGSILFSGNWNNSTTTTVQATFFWSPVTLWVQIGSNYYVMEYSTSILHKMTVSPSSVGSWGNGYLTDVATLNLTTSIANSSTDIQAFATANVGGVNYIAIVRTGAPSLKALVMINADTMTLVGTWTFPSSPLGEAITLATNFGVFFDKFGKVWVVSYGFPTAFPTDPHGFYHGLFLSTGDPANPSGLTTTFVPASSLPTNCIAGNQPSFSAYNPNNHSVIVGIQTSGDTSTDNQVMIVLDLISFTLIASRFSTGSGLLGTMSVDWWDSTNDAGNLSAFQLGLQSDGTLNVPAVNTDTPSNTFFSMALSKLNPATLAQVSSTDVVKAINDSSVTDKPPRDYAHALAFCGVAFNSSIIVTTFSDDSNQDFNGGSPVYVLSLGLCGAPTPLGNPFIV